MTKAFKKFTQGYQEFKNKYAADDNSVMEHLADHGQKPELMVVSCCDSRVDPAVLLQCEPGDLFITRNVANIVPPYEADDKHHGTSAALEYGVCYLKIEHLIILGHSQCGGIGARFDPTALSEQDDFISNWVAQIDDSNKPKTVDDFAKQSLLLSHQNCLSFPWLKERVAIGDLEIHLWFFDIKTGTIYEYSTESNQYLPLES